MRSSHPFISETGTAKRYANKLVSMFSNSFNVHLLSTDSFEPSDGGLKGMNIFITSTFGNGDPPTMAQKLTGSPISTKTFVASFKVIIFDGNFQNISVTQCPPQKENK